MALDIDKLPDDPAVLKEMAARLSLKNDELTEQIALLWVKLYGQRSEQAVRLPSDPNQLNLFETQKSDGSGAPNGNSGNEKKSPVAPHERRHPVRRPLPENLPRVEILHDVPDAAKQCACGAAKECMGAECSERLDVIPPQFRVLQHIRPKYVCRVCEGTAEPDMPTVTIAPMPLELIAKSILSPGLLSYIITAKFVDGLPLYRQQGQFARLGVDVSRGTMCGWVIKAGEACAPLLEVLFEELIAGELVNVDETPLQVLSEPGRAATDKSYAWAFVGGSPEKPAVVFVYAPSRGAEVPRSVLVGYEGRILADGYAAYKVLAKSLNLVLHGCWAHARRNFVEVIKAAGEKIGEGDGLAQQAVHRIRQLYELEAKARADKLTVEEVARLRQEQAKPLLQALKKWLDDTKPKVPPRSLLGKAIRYALDEWELLVRYADTGFVPMDNNRVENAIRPLVVGRKAWLFCETPDGAHASMRLYSLVETAKANGLDPYWYLRCLFEKLPYAKTRDDYRQLLPQYIDRSWVKLLAERTR